MQEISRLVELPKTVCCMG